MVIVDTVIVGAGPGGLTLAHYLSGKGKRIIVIDRESTIGGCHRVRRVNGYFTEHGPRIYVSSYFTLNDIIKDIGKKWSDYFVDYLPVGKISEPIFKVLTKNEIFAFAKAFVKFAIIGEKMINVSVYSFMVDSNFSKDSMRMIDRICRMTDGADSKRYTMYEFLNLINQNAFYKIQQPNRALDKGLFPDWQRFLESRGVDFMLGVGVMNINNEDSITLTDERIVTASKFYFTVPPENIVKIARFSFDKNLFGEFNKLKEWSQLTRYNNYIPITFHWDVAIDLPVIWDYPQYDWGIMSIILSDFFKSGESKTLISTSLSVLDQPSQVTGKTANETVDVDTLIAETFRQLQISYPELPKYSRAILSPGVYHNGQKWLTQDSAFMLTSDGYWTAANKYPSIEWVGIHQGNSEYAFTAFQTACDNSLVALGMTPKRLWTILDVLKILLLIFVIVIAKSIL